MAVPVLLGIVLAAVALAAACVVSIVFRPDSESLRPIDGEDPGTCEEPQTSVDRKPPCDSDSVGCGDPGRNGG